MQHWVLSKAKLTSLVGPDNQTDGDTRLRAWPNGYFRAHPRSRPVAFLVQGLGLNLDDKSDRSDLDECLRAAWTQVQSTFSADPERRAFDFTKTFVAPVDRCVLLPGHPPPSGPRAVRPYPLWDRGAGRGAPARHSDRHAAASRPDAWARRCDTTRGRRPRMDRHRPCDCRAKGHWGLDKYFRPRRALRRLCPLGRAFGAAGQRTAAALRARIQGRQDQHPQLLHHDGDGRRHRFGLFRDDDQRAAVDRQLPAACRPRRPSRPGRGAGFHLLQGPAARQRGVPRSTGLPAANPRRAKGDAQQPADRATSRQRFPARLLHARTCRRRAQDADRRLPRLSSRSERSAPAQGGTAGGELHRVARAPGNGGRLQG